jgi:hypothetical protein
MGDTAGWMADASRAACLRSFVTGSHHDLPARSQQYSVPERGPVTRTPIFPCSSGGTPLQDTRRRGCERIRSRLTHTPCLAPHITATPIHATTARESYVFHETGITLEWHQGAVHDPNDSTAAIRSPSFKTGSPNASLLMCPYRHHWRDGEKSADKAEIRGLRRSKMIVLNEIKRSIQPNFLFLYTCNF